MGFGLCFTNLWSNSEKNGAVEFGERSGHTFREKKLQSRVVAQRAPNVACSVALWHSFFVPSLIEISPYLLELWAESAVIGPQSKCHKTTANAILGTHRTWRHFAATFFSVHVWQTFRPLPISEGYRFRH